MSSMVISHFADKFLNACCGDTVISSKLPFKKNDINDEDENVEEKKEEIPAVPSKKENEEKTEEAPVAPVKEEEEETKPETKVSFTDFEMKYEFTLWDDLPSDAKAAAEELGFDENKWNASEEVHVGHKPWNHLTESELKAVQTLGWEETAWEDQYEHEDWDELPELQKRAAEAAGYTASNWDAPPHEQPDHLQHKRWDDLDEKDRKCMAVLGYTKHDWD
mmetsp:Transcript_16706/g.27108  ORF Transcript_16706/g.27108 Transcript_16706/m.27108 type:complete len:220 (-) Transcript_16706:1610-2269(-)